MVGPGMAAQGQASTAGLKADLSLRCQQLRDLVTLQEQGMKIFSESCEQKLRQNGELLPSLREALQKDTRVLDFVLKYNKFPPEDAFAEGQALVGATESLQVVLKKLEAKVNEQVKVCDLLLHQVKQWSQARDERQRYLQQLRDAEMDDKWQQSQLQAIRQLGNDFEKMVMKIHTGQIVTSLYLQVQDVLRKELIRLPQYLDLLRGMTGMYEEELVARDNLKAADVIKKLMAEAGPRVHLEKSLRDQARAEQRSHLETLQLEAERERQLREQAAAMLSAEHTQSSSEMTGNNVDAAMIKMEREAFVAEKMEKAKAALQCSCLWDIPGSLLAHQKSMNDIEQHIKECKEQRQTLRQMVKDMELKQAKLKFHQPLNTASLREEELRMNLQQEEARLEQLRAQVMRNEEQLIEFRNGIDNLFVLLHGIALPGQEGAVKAVGLEEKLRQCEQKLRYLQQRVSDRPAETHVSDENSEVFVKVRNLLEEKAAEDKQNLKISFEDMDAVVEDSLDFEEEGHEYVPSWADIKKQGLHLIKINTRRGKRK